LGYEIWEVFFVGFGTGLHHRGAGIDEGDFEKNLVLTLRVREIVTGGDGWRHKNPGSRGISELFDSRLNFPGGFGSDHDIGVLTVFHDAILVGVGGSVNDGFSVKTVFDDCIHPADSFLPLPRRHFVIYTASTE